MAVDPWVLLLAGSTLVIVGFLAAQFFDRFRIPDYFVLMALGLLLGSGFVPILGSDTRDSLAVVAPVFTNLALAFILFEGGLALRGMALGRSTLPVAGHTFAAMAITGVGIWFFATSLLGLTSITGVILAAAFIGPSAAIVLSVLPSLRVRNETRIVLTLEGVLGNVLAVAVIIVFVRFPGTVPDTAGLVLYAGQVATTAMGAALLGALWHRIVGVIPSRNFSFMTTVAVAVFLYAVGEGLLGGNGGVAAFAFGLVLGRKGTLIVDEASPHGAPRRRGLPEFHRELVFLLRTFFFLYLGIRIQLGSIDLLAIAGALGFVAVFLASRIPSSMVLAWLWKLPKLDVRVLQATVARGMTDTVLILYAIQVQVVPATEATLVTSLLFLVILSAATASAVLVALAERTARLVPAPKPAPSPFGTITRPTPVLVPVEPASDPIDEPPPS